MVRLHWNCRTNHLCNQLCLQRISLEDELKYWMSAESNDSIAILPQLTSIVHLNAFQTQKSGLNGMGIWILQMTAKTTGTQTMYYKCNWTMAMRIQKPWSGGMYVRHWTFLDRFGLYDSPRRRLERRWRRSIKSKRGGIKGIRQRRPQWVNVFSPCSLCSLTENLI